MKKFFTKKIVDKAQEKTLIVYNPIRERIRKHISDINDIITDDDLKMISFIHPGSAIAKEQNLSY